MDAAEIIAKCVQETDLEFLVIGGLAVIAYGYSRDTVDLDYLVRRNNRREWTAELARHGYAIFHEHDNFAQFTSPDSIDVDLMFVNDQTFDKLWSESSLKPVGGTRVRFPALDHLVALKLHVIKQNIPHRIIRDLDDVMNLVKLNQVDLRSDKWRELFDRHGTRQIYEQLLGPGPT
ncbi:MAG: hypothetical protein JWM99_4471 [Verrucomicrobiales bacterium]|jgi:hypothetical protein|nr:hypothetical protein [Verrucomicrobiales bacterium]